MSSGSNSEKKGKPSTPVKASLPVSNKQIETRTSDGRRRITPIFVAPAPDIGYVQNERPVRSAYSSQRINYYRNQRKKK